MKIGTSWDELGQVGTSWEQLGQVGTSWEPKKLQKFDIKKNVLRRRKKKEEEYRIQSRLEQRGLISSFFHSHFTNIYYCNSVYL